MNLSSVKPGFVDTLLIQTPHYYGQFALSMRKESLCIDYCQQKAEVDHLRINTDTFYGTLTVNINGV